MNKGKDLVGFVPRKQFSLRNNYDLWIGFIIISFGVLLRTVQYLHNRSLWLDEALLVANLMDRSLQQIAEPLSGNQASPLGFLFAVKILTKMFGTSEYVLRLLPFISGIVFLPLFFFLARNLLDRDFALIALFFVSFSPSLIYYSSEFKPYSSDALICLSLFILAFFYLKKNGDIVTTSMLGVAGVILIWLSFPAAFVLAGIGLVFAFQAVLTKNYRRLGILMAIAFLWLASFVVQYYVSLRFIEQNQILDEFWRNYFAPFPPRSYSDVRWYIDHSLEVLQILTKTPMQGLTLFCIILGGIAFFRQNRLFALILFSALPFVFLASALHRYPFTDRLMLFFLPVLYVTLMKGIEWLRSSITRGSTFIVVLMICFIGYFPVNDAVNNWVKPSDGEELRTVIQYARHNWQADDLYVVYYASSPAFKYYARALQIPKEQYVYAEYAQDPKTIESELQKYQGKRRVWFFFSHNRGNDVPTTLILLDQLGKQIQNYQAVGASAYLYDLTK